MRAVTVILLSLLVCASAAFASIGLPIDAMDPGLTRHRLQQFRAASRRSEPVVIPTATLRFVEKDELPQVPTYLPPQLQARFDPPPVLARQLPQVVDVDRIDFSRITAMNDTLRQAENARRAYEAVQTAQNVQRIYDMTRRLPIQP